MKHSISFRQVLLLIVIVTLFFLAVIRSEVIKKGVSDGIELCLSVIIPSLYPMLILINMISGIGTPRYLQKISDRPLHFLFGVSGRSVLSIPISLIGGYPTAVKGSRSAYENGLISKEEAVCCASFFTSPGIPFTVNIVGRVYFHSALCGVTLLFSCAAADLLTAIVFTRIIKVQIPDDHPILPQKNDPFGAVLTKSVKESSESILSICSWLIVFSGFYAVLFEWIPSESVKNVLTLFFEVTKAAEKCGETGNLPLCAFILSFSGICLIMQIVPDLQMLGISVLRFTGLRLLSALISCLIQTQLMRLLKIEAVTGLPKELIKFSGGSASGSVALIILCVTFLFSVNQKKYAEI